VTFNPFNIDDSLLSCSSTEPVFTNVT